MMKVWRLEYYSTKTVTISYIQRWATATLLIASLPLPLFVTFYSGATTPVTK